MIKDIEFRTNDYYYPLAVSSCGVVKNLKTDYIRKLTIGSHGYYITSKPSGSCYTIHRMVAEIWIPNPENLPCVNHKDFNKLNNDISNLEWVTYSENSQHAASAGRMSHGNRISGEKSNFSFYSDELVHSICKDIENGMRNIEITEKYGVGKSFAKGLKSGKLRREITSQYNLIKFEKRSVSEDVVRWICECLVKGMTSKEIIAESTDPNVKLTLIKNIRRKGSYKAISDQYF